MPTPGGGPSRRSHTKSRKGCKTCKKRHIRCDEEFPQCKNCTKHQVRCDYMDAPAMPGEGSNSSQHIDLLWTPEISEAVSVWAATNEFPFPSLQLHSQLHWSAMSKVDLRLLYHVASITHSLRTARTSHLTTWVDLMPKFFNLMAGSPLVLSSVLAFSATHLAWISQNPETSGFAMHVSSTTLETLREAITQFSQANSDSVLASLLLLGWTAPDFQVWSSLTQSRSAVIQNMQGWRNRSVFEDYLVQQATGPAPPPTDFSSKMNPEARQIRLEVLQQCSLHLSTLLSYLPVNEQEHSWTKQIQEYIHRLSTSGTPYTAVEQFGRLHAMRDWLTWVPVQLLANNRGGTFTFMALSYLFSVAVAIQLAFPTIAAWFTTDLAARPLEEIIKILDGPVMGSPGQQMTNSHPLMAFLRSTLAAHEDSRYWPAESRHSQTQIPSYRQLASYKAASNLPSGGVTPGSSSAYSRTLPQQSSNQSPVYASTPIASPLHSSPSNITPVIQPLGQQGYLDVPNAGGQLYAYDSMQSPYVAGSLPTSSVNPILNSSFSYTNTNQAGHSQSMPVYGNYGGAAQSSPAVMGHYGSSSTPSGFVNPPRRAPAVWTAVPRSSQLQHAYTYPGSASPRQSQTQPHGMDRYPQI